MGTGRGDNIQFINTSVLTNVIYLQGIDNINKWGEGHPIFRVYRQFYLTYIYK